MPEQLLDTAYEKLSWAKKNGTEEEIKEAQKIVDELHDAFSDL